MLNCTIRRPPNRSTSSPWTGDRIMIDMIEALTAIFGIPHWNSGCSRGMNAPKASIVMQIVPTGRLNEHAMTVRYPIGLAVMAPPRAGGLPGAKVEVLIEQSPPECGEAYAPVQNR